MSKATSEELLQVETLVLMGEYSNASKLIEKLEKHPHIPLENLLLIRYYKGLVLLGEGKINSAIDIGQSNYYDA